MREFAAQFYKSKAWKDCRSAFMRYRGGLCERCLASGIYSAGEIVHHKTHLTPENIGDPEISLSFSNLELLCREHHADCHRGFERRWHVDEFGHVEAK